jgi:hypothetical protein
MRRMTIALLAFCALGAMMGTASAETWTGSIQGGASIPSGDFGSSEAADAGAGWSLGGSVDYHWKDGWAFGVDGSYGQNQGGTEGAVTDLGSGNTLTIDKDSFNTWSLGGHAKYFFPTAATMPVKWYGLVGAGIYGFTNDVEATRVIGGNSVTLESSRSDKRIGTKLGLGGLWWANPQVGVHGGIDYNLAFMDKDESPYSSLSYMGAHVGVTFNIPTNQGP